MALADITMTFDPNYVGVMHAPNGDVLLGMQDGGMEPYHLLFGALGSCYYATFLVMSRKMKADFDHVDIKISGNKRDAEIATLEHVQIDMKIYGGDNEKSLMKCAELGAKYCSIHSTISKVAEMKLNVTFLEK